MKKLVFVASVLVVAAVFFAWHLLGTPSDLRFIQSSSGIQLPGGLRNVDTYDNGESFVVAHVTLPADKIEAFVAENGFAPFDTSDIGPETWAWGLSAQWRTVPAGAELLQISGPAPNTHWHFWLDRKTGDLWILVRYTDYAGDL
jgi:hypothetical protein